MKDAIGPVSLQEALALRDKTQLLKELKQFLDDIRSDSEVASEEWAFGHSYAIRSVEQWVVDQLVKLGYTLKERNG